MAVYFLVFLWKIYPISFQMFLYNVGHKEGPSLRRIILLYERKYIQTAKKHPSTIETLRGKKESIRLYIYIYIYVFSLYWHYRKLASSERNSCANYRRWAICFRTAVDPIGRFRRIHNKTDRGYNCYFKRLHNCCICWRGRCRGPTEPV